MSEKDKQANGEARIIDYDIHGFVGIRFINPCESDANAVAKQLGPMRAPLRREPDIIVRFVQDLPMSELRFLGLNKVGFTNDGFFILASSKKQAKVRLAFDEIGKRCEIVCETGLRSVPFLMVILNLTLLSKNIVALHASAFDYNGLGILVCGWAKGGKTEALLSFAPHGAEYIGDEWIYLSQDGASMFGIPENIRLWDWHLAYLPHLKAKLSREKRWLFKGVNFLDRLQKRLKSTLLANTFPMKLLNEAMPAFKRQLNVQFPPEVIFEKCSSSFSSSFDKLFLIVSHENPDYYVKAVDSMEIADRMISSIQYELLPFMESYLAYKFAFPERKCEFLEQISERQHRLLKQALDGKEAYTVAHPYPISFPELFAVMDPHCRGKAATEAEDGSELKPELAADHV